MAIWTFNPELRRQFIEENPRAVTDLMFDNWSIDIMKKKNPYEILLDTFGEEIQFQCAIEEMGELLQAICKYKRKRASNNEEETRKALENLQEEIADVTINMEQLTYMFGEKEIKNIKENKIQRALRRAEKHDMELK